MTGDSRNNVRSALCVMTDEYNQLCALLEAKEDVICILESELVKAQTTIQQLKVIKHSTVEQEVEQLKGQVHKKYRKRKGFGS